jgi:hypothetical protein
MESRNGGGKPSLDAKLAKNYRDLPLMSIQVEAGADNLTKQLHPARFLPGALCSTADLWLQANRHLIEKRLEVYAHYDTQGLGITHIFNAKLWAILHDPGSQDISIKLFLQAQAGENTDSSNFYNGMADGLDSFKRALKIAGAAQRLVTPWNFSIEALHIFLENTKYGYKFFSSQKEHVTKLTEFVDLVLRANATNWQLGKPFLGAMELAQYWAMFTAGCSTAPTRSSPFPAQKRKSSPIRDSKDFRTWPKPKDGDACVRFNEGRCTRPENACSYRGAKLSHKCSFKMSSGRECGRPHPSKFHR